jgi:flavin reductase
MISFARDENRPVGIVEGLDLRLPLADRKEFTDAMARAVNGVGIVTTDGPYGRWGVTVSSVVSVSADPPLLLVCINRRSPAADAIRGHGGFGVSLLSIEHRTLADSFAGWTESGRPFDFNLAEWAPGASGSPVLVGATASFDCQLDRAIEAGSHTVFFGRAVEARAASGRSLLYTRRAYGEAHAL